jgi:hypothetical protein
MVASQVIWPRKPPAITILHSQQICVDFVAYLWSYVRMRKGNETVSRLKAQYEADMRALHGVLAEQAKLRIEYLRYCDLERQAKERIERIRRLTVVLWPHEACNIKQTVFSRASEMGIALPEGWETPAVWEVVLEIVRQFPNIQMVDLLQQLQELGVEASRQSVDSALKAHPELFAYRRVGKGKYISLVERSIDATSAERKRT